VGTSQKPHSWLVSDLFHPAGARFHSTFIYFDFIGGMAGSTSKQKTSTLYPRSAVQHLGDHASAMVQRAALHVDPGCG